AVTRLRGYTCILRNPTSGVVVALWRCSVVPSPVGTGPPSPLTCPSSVGVSRPLVKLAPTILITDNAATTAVQHRKPSSTSFYIFFSLTLEINSFLEISFSFVCSERSRSCVYMLF
ncbi:unnamed protein product, partial [Owenia fusiformis]